MWASEPHITFETNKISGEFVGIPHGVQTTETQRPSLQPAAVRRGCEAARGAKQFLGRGRLHSLLVQTQFAVRVTSTVLV